MVLGSSWSTARSDAALAALPALTDQPLFLVGGAVRDLLRGETAIRDWDIAVPEGAIALARRFADAIGGAFVPLHEAQPTARVVKDSVRYDFIQYRGETLDADLRQRDLTINAIAADLRALLAGAETPLIDPTGGVADLAAGRLRPCGPDVFRADPLRAVRLYRFVATLGFLPTAAADVEARDVAPRITAIAPERVTDELAILLAADGAAPAIRGFVGSGLWEALVPEAAPTHGMAQGPNHHLDVFGHDEAAAVAAANFLRVLDDWAAPQVAVFRDWLQTPTAGERTRRWLVPLAALLHDIGKPVVRRVKPDGAPSFPRHEQAGTPIARAVARRLRLARGEANLLAAFVRHHGRPNDLQKHDDAAHRLRMMAVLRDAAPGTIIVGLGDRASACGPARPPAKVAHDIAFLEGLLRDYFGTYAPLLVTPPLVRGEEVMRALCLPPGPQVGHLLLLLRRRQLAGELADATQALEVAKRLLGGR